MTGVAEVWRYIRAGEQKRERDLQPALWRAAIITSGPPAGPVVWGVDVAGVYDGVPDYALMKALGGSFVIIKAVDGTIGAKLFRENVDAARSAGLAVGAYFWLYRVARISAAAQAGAWWSAVRDLGLPVHVVDYEWTKWAGAQDNPTLDDLAKVIDAYKALSGIDLWIYTAPGFQASFPARFAVNRLWQAQYGVPAPQAIAPWGLGGFTLWQESDRWAVPFCDSSASHVLDGDRFNGSAEQFEAVFGSAAGGAVDPDDGGGSVAKVIQGTVLGSVKIRNAPAGAEFIPPRYLYPGNTIEASENSAQWLHLTKINGVAVSDTEWASAGSSQQYIRWSWVDVVTPPPPSGGEPVVTGATVHFEDGSSVELVPVVPT